MFDRIRDWWETMAPRERLLILGLGVTLVVCVFGWIGFQINDGLTELAEKNQATQDALDTIDERRDELMANRAGGSSPVAQIGATAEPLATYLEGIEGEIGVKISNVTPERTAPKGKFTEKSLQVTLYDVTVDQLARFLQRIEEKSPVVVTQKLHVKRSTSQPEKLDRVEVTVATWERAGAKKTAAARGAAAKDEEGADKGKEGEE